MLFSSYSFLFFFPLVLILARNLEMQREYERIKAREYRARRKAQTAAAQPAQ